jgi:hypothetical protein
MPRYQRRWHDPLYPLLLTIAVFFPVPVSAQVASSDVQITLTPADQQAVLSALNLAIMQKGLDALPTALPVANKLFDAIKAAKAKDDADLAAARKKPPEPDKETKP